MMYCEKSFDSRIINGILDYILEPLKNITDRHEGMWNVILKN